MSETSPNYSTPPSNEIARPAAFEANRDDWEVQIIPLSHPPIRDRKLTMPHPPMHHWGVPLIGAPWALRPACNTDTSGRHDRRGPILSLPLLSPLILRSIANDAQRLPSSTIGSRSMMVFLPNGMHAKARMVFCG